VPVLAPAVVLAPEVEGDCASPRADDSIR